MPERNQIIYPIHSKTRLPDRLALKTGFAGIGFCPVCGRISRFIAKGESLRETCHCIGCGCSNRKRQLAYVLCKAAQQLSGRKLNSLRDVAQYCKDVAIYNTESSGALHQALHAMPKYCSSEYLGPDYKSGAVVSGVRHEDLMALSFPDASFDIVLSADVLEHVPEPYRAHREIYRVLKPNGRHIFTVPFRWTEFLDEHRTKMTPDGCIAHLNEPVYHPDPLRPEGALVHTVFSLEMLVRLAEIGFRTNLWHLYKPHYGILGADAIVFEAIKQ